MSQHRAPHLRARATGGGEDPAYRRRRGPGIWEWEGSIDIRAPVAEVYRRLVDFPRHTDFSPALESIERLTSGPVAVGTRFRVRERVPRTFKSWTLVTGLEEPARIAWRAWVPFVMTVDWEVELSEGDRGTHLVQRCRWRGGSPLGSLLLHAVRRRQIPLENQRTLHRLKEVLERSEKHTDASPDP